MADEQAHLVEQSAGWLKKLGAKLDRLLEVRSGMLKDIIDTALRMPLFVSMLAFATLGPYFENRQLDLPLLVVRICGKNRLC
ncbi:hypothetical protein DPMN_126473 [Dreissena polymorpha]|uniref:Uncharacterized protein n=1 Tax=Dreissena polymorpha TaxID=45954 RepID=A0A9D4H046_DREPO|nr:hypothetical protein DPMN_126473 [Dreissena polymorpha]